MSSQKFGTNPMTKKPSDLWANEIRSRVTNPQQQQQQTDRTGKRKRGVGGVDGDGGGGGGTHHQTIADGMEIPAVPGRAKIFPRVFSQFSSGFSESDATEYQKKKKTAGHFLPFWKKMILSFFFVPIIIVIVSLFEIVPVCLASRWQSLIKCLIFYFIIIFLYI